VIRVQREDFDVGREIYGLTAGRHGIGGVVTFIGLVRDFVGKERPKGGKESAAAIAAMTLEHYPAMTERQLADIEAEATSRWPLDASLIIHRYGRLEPGDRIVLVATAAAHREDAFAACQFLIDWLKTKAPFWKLEDTSAGAKWVAADARDDTLAARWEKK
jgi:molybdopterin synthase catalytic subunit